MYLILRGTKTQVRRPDGRVVDRVLPRDIALTEAPQLIGYHLHFKRDGFTLIVAPKHVRTIKVICPTCWREI